MRAAVIVLAFAGLAALGCRSPTQISLVVSTDVPCKQFKGVTITVGHLDEIETKTPNVITGDERCTGDALLTRLGSLVVTPSGSKDEEVAIKVVVGVSGAASLCKYPKYEGCVVARRALRFVPHEPLDLPIGMAFRCLDNPCDPHTTCVDGYGCVPATIDDSTQCKGDGCDDRSLVGGRGPKDGGVADGTTDTRDGGDAGDAPADVGPVPGHVLEIATGTGFACAHLEDHTLMCWGSGNHGQLNNGKSVDSYVPAKVSPFPGVVRQLAVGDNIACVLLEDKTVTCWGQNESGECGFTPSSGATPPSKIPRLGNAAQVAVGFRHACARLEPDGSVKCWGSGGDGLLGDGLSTGSPDPVFVRGITNAVQITPECARLGNGEVWCWGEGNVTPKKVPGLPKKAIDIADAPEGKVIVVLEGGEVYWAHRDFAGGWDPVAAVALKTPGTSPVKRAVSHYGQSHELLADGSLYLVDGLDATPTLVPGLGPGTVLRLDAGVSDDYGRGFQCVLLTSGAVKCWGADLHGELGIDRPSAVRTPQHIPATALSGVKRVRRFEAGFGGVVAAIKTDGSISAWGRGLVVALNDVATPTAMTKLGTGNKDVGLGADLQRGYVIRATGSVVSVEAGATGSTGLSGKFSDFDSVLIAGSFHLGARSSSGPLEFLAITAEANTDGIYGLGNKTGAAVGSVTPVSLPGRMGVAGHGNDFGTANQALCSWFTDGTVSCWGDNQTGVCGSATRALIFDKPRAIEFPVPTPHITTMSMWTDYACAISDAADGQRVYCWGDNGDQQLGVASPDASEKALRVPGISKAVGVTCFGTSTCVWLDDADKTVWCWGNNSHGELGDGTVISRATPAIVPGLKGIVSMDGSCAVQETTGEVWCWGESYYGQAGVGITGLVTTPTEVKGL